MPPSSTLTRIALSGNRSASVTRPQYTVRALHYLQINCISIMHMWQTRTHLKATRSSGERSCQSSNVYTARFGRPSHTQQMTVLTSLEYHQYHDNLTLLAALQAITIYILLQAREKEQKERACVALILTMGVRYLPVLTTSISSTNNLEQ